LSTQTVVFDSSLNKNRLSMFLNLTSPTMV